MTVSADIRAKAKQLDELSNKASSLYAYINDALEDLDKILEDVDELVGDLRDLADDVLEDEIASNQPSETKPPLGDRITEIYHHPGSGALRVLWNFDDFSNWAWNNQSKFAILEQLVETG